jgi:zinc protease
LGNGVRGHFETNGFQNDQVVMNASRFGGQYLFDPKERFNAEFAATVVAQMGVGQFSPVDLRKVLAGKTATVTRGSGPSLKDSTVSAALSM